MLDTLRDIEGLDVDLGLEILLGKLRVYLRLLRQYACEQGGNLTRLGESLAADDRDALRYLAHSIKSTSGSLGVVGAQSVAFALEKAAKEGCSREELQQRADALVIELGRIAAELLAALPAEETVDDHPDNPTLD